MGGQGKFVKDKFINYVLGLSTIHTKNFFYLMLNRKKNVEFKTGKCENKIKSKRRNHET
jgi:hypothetical protein